MKRLLFCTAVVALTAACTNEDDFSVSQNQNNYKGLTFETSLAEGATSRGELSKDEDGTYPFFWYAETDRINVIADNVDLNVNNTDANGKATIEKSTGAWTLPNAAVSYKATKSEANGFFTAASDEDMLNLTETEKGEAIESTVLATYGDVKVGAGATSNVDSKGNPIAGDMKALVLATTASNATQTVAGPNVVAAPMYSVSSAKKDAAYESFGEKASLKLIRPFPLVRFTTTGVEKDYGFGALQSVEMTSVGAYKDGKEVQNAASSIKSNLAYATDKNYTVIGTTTGFEAGYAASSKPETAKVSLTATTDWTDADATYMTVAPVDRSALKKAGAQDSLTITYTFANIEFKVGVKTSSNWSSVSANGNPNAITATPALDINSYNYLLTNETSSDDRTLIVLKGNFKDIFDATGKKIKWNGGEIAATEVGKIISNVALTDAEQAKLVEFTNLTDLTLNENTSIAAKALTEGQVGAMVSLNLPKVTSINKNFATSAATFKALKTLKMPAYQFGDATVNGAFFNETEKGVLETLDMSGVTSMLPIFGIQRTLSFTDYTALKDVTVAKDLVVAPQGFKGCSALAKVTGTVDIASAPNAFEGAAALTTININGTVIPADAFNGCTKLATVKFSGAAVVPTEIGAHAFKSTDALLYMDLSKATTIGTGAFESAGITSTSKDVATLTVGATEVAADLFKSAAYVKMVKFTDATKIAGAGAFTGASALTQIKFLKVITLADAASAYGNTVFGANAGDIDLWVNPAQTGVDGLSLTLTYNVGKTPASVTNSFKSIQKKIAD